MANKFLNLKDQIEKLKKEKNIIILDFKDAEENLKKINYSLFFSPYKELLADFPENIVINKKIESFLKNKKTKDSFNPESKKF